jgi:hypothetical protein
MPYKTYLPKRHLNLLAALQANSWDGGDFIALLVKMRE